ncbi:hypothetical protein [Drosophila suzukii associated hytrosavirus 1]|nr:hypothetical protein [Drosophila suzukii associated hytrosavirus 1]
MTFSKIMAYNTVASTSNSSAAPPPADVITVLQEKDFVLQRLFHNDKDAFEQSNIYANIYEGEHNDALVPLTSIVYTPNRRFFENSKFYRQITNNKTQSWLKKHNILVLVYGITSKMDYNLQTQKTYNDSLLIMDIIETSGCITSPRMCIPTAFKAEEDVPTQNEEMVNLLRFEDSPFNYRLNAIKDRIKNVYACNFSPINYLVFNDLNDDVCINKFIKNTINVSLT